MDELNKSLLTYKEKNKATDEDCANLLGISIDEVKQIEDKTYKSSDVNNKRLSNILQLNTKTIGKRIVKILDLIFRFLAMIMPLVAMLLCINGYSDTKTLVTLLSIGAVATSIMMLPRNEK